MPYGNWSPETKILAAEIVRTKDPDGTLYNDVKTSPASSEKYLRGGNNSSWSSGGWSSYTSYKTYSYVKKVGYELVPRRRYRWVNDRKSGRRYKQYYIVHVRRAIRIRVVKRKPYIRYVWHDPQQSWTANYLLYERVSAERVSQNEFTAYRASDKQTISVSADPGFSFGCYNETSLLKSGFSDPGYGASSTQFDDAEQKALFRLYEKVSREYPNYLLMSAEADKTLALVSSILKEGVSIIRNIKKLQVSALAGRLKGFSPKKAADMWLAYTYGVQPLIADVNNTLRDLSREATSRRIYHTTQALDIPPQVYTSQNDFTSYTTTRTIKANVRASVIIDANMGLPGGADVRGFSLNAFASTAWELIPFSFMVDWLVPIGSYLGASGSIGQNAAAFWFTHFWKEEVTRSGQNDNTVSSFVPDGGSAGAVILKQVRVERSVQTAPSMPLPQVNFGDSIGWRRALNALAIAIQRT